MQIDPVPAVPESEATGEIAEIYADIRTSLGIDVVNLVWRHLATLEGALPWVWSAVRPAYLSGTAANEAVALLEDLELPAMEVMPSALLRQCGVPEHDHNTLRAVLDTYNRGNAINLVALSALEAIPAGESGSRPKALLPTVSHPIPALPGLDELEPDTRSIVLALSGLGAGTGDRIIPSLYRHLGRWPGFLALVWALISPLHVSGHLSEMIREAEATGKRHAGRLGCPVRTGPPPATADPALRAISEFRRTAISRMVPIAMIVRRAVG